MRQTTIQLGHECMPYGEGMLNLLACLNVGHSLTPLGGPNIVALNKYGAGMKNAAGYPSTHEYTSYRVLLNARA